MRNCPECEENGRGHIITIDYGCGMCLGLTDYDDSIRLHDAIHELINRTHEGPAKEALREMRSMAWSLVESLYDRSRFMTHTNKGTAYKGE
jgi:hypothetical protein